MENYFFKILNWFKKVVFHWKVFAFFNFTYLQNFQWFSEKSLRLCSQQFVFRKKSVGVKPNTEPNLANIQIIERND